MCGRYSLALRPSQVRAYLENENMPVDDAPADDEENGPRQSYNFAPGYHGLVYRADTPDRGAGSDEEQVEGEQTEGSVPESHAKETKYKLQSMRWGLIPFWTKSNPDYGSMMKTINCRDDSLIDNRGMWTSMKQKKRCIIIAQGFYEWLKKGPKDKVPHFVKRKDGQLMCFAGLWDCVQYEGSADKIYTYTVITTSSNKQLNFLHDRMPVILENGSEEIQTWLDPKRTAWSKELQCLLRPFQGEVDVYAVSKDVGKVGNNSPSFIIPVASRENKSNIANFFGKDASKGDKSTAAKPSDTDDAVKKEEEQKPSNIKHEPGEDRETLDHQGTEDNAPLPIPKKEIQHGLKRGLDDVQVSDSDIPSKAQKLSESPIKDSAARNTRSATSNKKTSPKKPVAKEKGAQKITSFFSK